MDLTGSRISRALMNPSVDLTELAQLYPWLIQKIVGADQLETLAACARFV